MGDGQHTFLCYSGSSYIIDILYLYLTSPKALCCVLEQDTLSSQLGKMTEKSVDWDIKHQHKLTIRTAADDKFCLIFPNF